MNTGPQIVNSVSDNIIDSTGKSSDFNQNMLDATTKLVANDHEQSSKSIFDELQRVKAERDHYLSKLLLVRNRIEETKSQRQASKRTISSRQKS